MDLPGRVEGALQTADMDQQAAAAFEAAAASPAFAEPAAPISALERATAAVEGASPHRTCP